MSLHASLIQIVGLIAVAAGLVAFVEAWLFWLLRYYNRSYFVLVSCLLGIGIGLIACWLLGLPLLPIAGYIGAATSILALFFRHFVQGANRLAFYMIAPAFVVVCLLIVYPFFFQLRIAFSDLNLFTVGRWLQGEPLGWVGFRNFARVFTNPHAEGGLEAIITAEFWILLGRTILWTSINVVFHVGFGLGLALLLNRDVMFKGLYRAILIVPWAMPQVVAVLAWRGEFHPQFGVVNHLLGIFGVAPINWWSDPIAVFASVCIVNIWLGIPFMLIVFLGGLGAIPKSYYEAAAIDGASKWAQFREITLPLLKPVVIPSVTLGTIWTFNNINVIYLMTGQDGGNDYADILVSALYKSAFTYSRFGYSAAFAVVVFAILISITAVWIRITRAGEGDVAR